MNIFLCKKSFYALAMRNAADSHAHSSLAWVPGYIYAGKILYNQTGIWMLQSILIFDLQRNANGIWSDDGGTLDHSAGRAHGIEG